MKRKGSNYEQIAGMRDQIGLRQMRCQSNWSEGPEAPSVSSQWEVAQMEYLQHRNLSASFSWLAQELTPKELNV